ncbi:MAG: M50 family metallopeptidase [Chitinivibrionales bacterium]
MFGKRITLFKLMGFKVRVDLSWLIIVALVVWSLASGVFPYYYEDLPASSYWIMGVIGAIGLFLSIIAHEFTHSLVARRFGMPMEGITLFIFGGVAEMEEEPPSAKAEFFMAFAGPLSSILIGFLFWGLTIISRANGGPVIATGVFNYLKLINWILAGFNLLPAFPLDGGRVLRSILWQWKHNLSQATKMASSLGSGFGLLLIVGGIFFLFSGAFIGGIWWILIGLFLRQASQMSYRRILMRKALEGEKINRFMQKDPVTVSPSTSVKDLVENYIYKYHYRMYPVTDNGHLQGCITTKEIKQVPQESWEEKTVQDIVHTCSTNNTISIDGDPVEALSLMNKTGNSRLLVLDKQNELAGVITIKDLLGFLSLKFDLEEDNLRKM